MTPFPSSSHFQPDKKTQVPEGENPASGQFAKNF
jgi:hypothetical protein